MKDRLETAKNHKQSTSLVIHQADEESIAQLLTDPETHASTFVDEISPILTEYGFSDLNIDIESFIEATIGAQQSFTKFIKSVRVKMEEKKLGTLSIDVPPISLIKPRLIDVRSIEPYADSIILMTYDYHYTGSYLAGPVAPLSGAGTITDFDVKTAVFEALKIVPSRKIILGIPLYGYEWDTASDIPGASVVPGTGKTASNARIAQVLTTCTTCELGRDTVSNEAYIIQKFTGYSSQIFYEDARSIQTKISLANDYSLGGVAVWALGYEEPGKLKLY